jgi:hypothetical protein
VFLLKTESPRFVDVGDDQRPDDHTCACDGGDDALPGFGSGEQVEKGVPEATMRMLPPVPLYSQVKSTAPHSTPKKKPGSMIQAMPTYVSW